MGDAENGAVSQLPTSDAAVNSSAAGESARPTQATDSVWDRIRRHKVVEWTLAYVAFGYALLHGVQMLRESFEWPLVVSRLTAVGLVLGAPIAVTLAWYHGHRARHRVSGQELSILIALLMVAGSVLWLVSKHTKERSATTAAVVQSVPFNPPAHSIAVLPFVNMSGDKEQEYFSEGLTEELLNSLSRINELQVAARTSSFSFQGEHPDIAAVAHKLNVGAVLEGSVRRSANTVRVTTQLINGVTGFHLWSQTYDRSLGDVLQLQTDIATAVASALKVTLLGDEAAKIEVGGTRNHAALDAYLRATKIYFSSENIKDAQAAIDGYTEAINLDPAYALAYAARSIASESLGEQWATTEPDFRSALDKAEPDARKAIALAPNMVEGHLALAEVHRGRLEFIPAHEQYEHALALGAGNARMLRDYGVFSVLMGRTEFGLTLLRRAVVLDPLNVPSHSFLGLALMYSRRYQEAVAAFNDAQALDRPNAWSGYIGLAYYLAGDFENAQSMCEKKVEGIEAAFNQYCLAMVYDKLGRHADAESMLTKCRTTWGDLGTASYAVVYAQWGNTARALDLLEVAMRAHLSDLIQLKHPLADPLRSEPRFQAIQRALNFPD